jgi:hypothetical protein
MRIVPEPRPNLIAGRRSACDAPSSSRSLDGRVDIVAAGLPLANWPRGSALFIEPVRFLH